MQTSRLTVRLPDLTSPRPRPVAPSPETIDPRYVDEANQAPPHEATEHVDDAAAPTLLARVYRFIGQPKIWLACITAIAVQVILALVFTPPAKPTAAPRTQRKPASAVSPQRTGVARIVVPPAETPTTASAEATSGATDLLASPQMQPTPPIDAAAPWEPLPTTSADPSEGTDTRGEAPGAPRLAEQKRLADDQQYDGRAAQESLGARLEGVMPIDDVEHEPNGGSGR
ncbi:MAG TPA: hypothetical protein VJ783_17070 [Pirellulales bacterium]|nr:hypothetical protein [Pirellulales bacterium]